MGQLGGLLAKTTVAHLRERKDLALPSNAVITDPSSAWIRFDVHVEPVDDDYGAASLSEALGCFVVVLVGHSVTEWCHYKLYEGGHCVRELEGGQDGWKVSGNAVQPWESAFVARRSRSIGGEEYDELSELDRAVIDSHALLDGAKLPTNRVEDFVEAAGLSRVLYGRTRVAVRERKGLFARLFG